MPKAAEKHYVEIDFYFYDEDKKHEQANPAPNQVKIHHQGKESRKHDDLWQNDFNAEKSGSDDFFVYECILPIVSCLISRSANSRESQWYEMSDANFVRAIFLELCMENYEEIWVQDLIFEIRNICTKLAIPLRIHTP